MHKKTPTAVLIHGYHLQAPEWELIAWGTNDLSKAGRVPRGIEIALEERADLIIWGTGASEDKNTGKKESEYTRDFAREHIDALIAYTAAPKEAILELLEKKSVLQVDTQNTNDEVREALKLCDERGINTLYLVSTPTHVPRCLLTACQVQDLAPGTLPIGVPSETYPEFWSPNEVGLIEPPHRPDRSEAPFNLLAKRMASSRKYPERAQKLFEDTKALLDAFDEETKK